MQRGHTAQLLWEGAGLLQELRGGGSADCQESQQGGGEANTVEPYTFIRSCHRKKPLESFKQG